MRVSRFRPVVLALMALAAMVVGGAIFVVNAARWLNNADAPTGSDAILVLAGSYLRPIHAGDLFRQGFAPVVYVSVPKPNPAAAPLAALGVQLVPVESTYEETLRAKGVPKERMMRLGSGALSTVDEADELRRLFAGRSAKVLVVTSPFHVRRARMIFGDTLQGTGITVAVVATPQEAFPDRWWTSQDAARDVLLEWSKILFYFCGGRFRAAA